MAVTIPEADGRAADRPEGDPPESTILRVLNFSGGGFDTVMQLGVTHALLVTQGRAPDIVVGVSAGAIQAAALASVLRAAPAPSDSLSDDEAVEAYTRTLNKRVTRFREFVDASHRAPEELVDALLPDAYQVDSFQPLLPLEQPTLFKAEREQRMTWIARKSGLIRLYNDLLALNIPVGIVTRLVRRYFGIRSIGNIGPRNAFGWLRRGIATLSELAKIWIVIGDQLTRLAPLVLMLGRPMLNDMIGGTPPTRHQTAESIMFRFGITDRLLKWGKSLLAFLISINIWVGASLLVLAPAIVALMRSADSPATTMTLVTDWLAVAVVFVVLTPLIESLTSRRPSLAGVFISISNFVQGLIVFVVSLLKWTVAMVALSAIPVAVVAVAGRLAVARGLDLDSLEGFITWIFVFAAFAGTIGLALLLFVLAVLLRPFVKPWIVHVTLRSFFVLLLLAFLPFTLLVTMLAAGEVLPPVLDAMGLRGVLDAQLELVPFDTLEQLERVAREGGQLDARSRTLLALSYAAVVIGLSVAESLAFGAIVVAGVLMSILVFRERRMPFSTWFTDRFLNRYGLAESLGHNYGLKRFLIERFDPTYYGKASVATAAQVALGDRLNGESEPAKRTIRDFNDPSGGLPAIRLGLAVADVKRAALEVVPDHHPIVDGLLAATAVAPIFPPLELEDPVEGQTKLYVDASTVGNMPTRPLMQMLRSHAGPPISAVHIYAVDPLPISHEKLGPLLDEQGEKEKAPYVNLIDAVVRALQLQRFRDATLERKLTSVFTEALPVDRDSMAPRPDGKKRIFRAYLAPVELDRPTELNRRILFTTKDERREQLVQAIAMGCRAALQTMLAETLASDTVAREARGTGNDRFIPCARAVGLYRKDNPVLSRIDLPGRASDAPGLAEICQHCSIGGPSGKLLEDPDDPSIKAERSLRVPAPATQPWPDTPQSPVRAKLPPEIRDWPHELDRNHEPAGARQPRTPKPDESAETRALPPAKVCLFGGGVFRGVLQMGVLTALSSVRFRPDIVAGSSVGAITAAMSGSILGEPDDAKRHRRLVELASVYIAMDRLVLTDRFADFIRNWTIRASEARFSIRDADTVFRKYDFAGSARFQKTLRAVVAGLERLFYINPYELNAIVSAARHRNLGAMTDRLKARAQGWLDRMNAGSEVLGAEPLRDLILEFVFPRGYDGDPEAARLDGLWPRTSLLATTTNLTEGELRVLGSIQDANNEDSDATLIEALLASSAFPGVFRPRRSLDLLPGSRAENEYVDGGIVDNLPLDPVLREIRSRTRLSPPTLGARPDAGPHLVVAASLEPETRPISAAYAKILKTSWPRLLKRTREFKYNIKLNMYESSLEDLKALHDQLERHDLKPEIPPLNVDIVAVKPEWLCSTFAFHPMLGFRRMSQVRSIAHGCAMTLKSLARVRSRAHIWNLDESAIPTVAEFDDVPQAQRAPERYTAGKCWLVDGLDCPFAKQRVRDVLPAKSAGWVGEIHRECWVPATHERRR